MTRMFPIMRGGLKSTMIPWAMIAPHEKQAQLNHDQTLERLAERGGLSHCEAIAVLEGRDWFPMENESAEAQLELLRKQYEETP